MQVSTAQGLEKLQTTKTLADKGYNVETLENKFPRIIIYDAPKNEGKEEIRKNLADRNNCIRDAAETDFRLLISIKAANGCGLHWVTERPSRR